MLGNINHEGGGKIYVGLHESLTMECGGVSEE